MRSLPARCVRSRRSHESTDHPRRLDLVRARARYAQDVYVANIIKCRPPGNRKPEPIEVETCIPYLHQQIAAIEPKVIVMPSFVPRRAPTAVLPRAGYRSPHKVVGYLRIAR
jgi:uracil-DNA glycosylase family 4